MEYTSETKGNAALATGIIGTVLGGIASAGGVSALWGHTNNNPEETAVTRHELNYVQELANKDHTIAKLESQQYTDAAVKSLSDQIAVWKNQVDQSMNAQAVYNATLNGTVSCIQGQVTALQNTVGQFTQLIIPNRNVMPGWGDVTITPSGSATVKGAIPSSGT